MWPVWRNNRGNGAHPMVLMKCHLDCNPTEVVAFVASVVCKLACQKNCDKAAAAAEWGTAPPRKSLFL